MTNVDVVIEIPKGSNVKYEYDKERHMIICDRVLHTPMKYPFNYGFIPKSTYLYCFILFFSINYFRLHLNPGLMRIKIPKK